MNPPYTVAELSEIVGGELRGDGSAAITGVADLRTATPSDASWLTSPKFREHLGSSRAGVILISASEHEIARTSIACENIQRSIASLLRAFDPDDDKSPSMARHPSAVVDPTARIGENVSIGPHATIEADVVIGDGCKIAAGVAIGRGVTIGNECNLQQNVVIRSRCRLGNRVTILPNSVIGGDGFGFHYDDGAHRRVPHIGTVIIEDDVEIGACTCIDRAKFGETIIGAGTKIDNLVQLAHNVRVGRNCVIVAQTGIAGSVCIGDGCVFAGRSGATDNVTVGDGAQIAATSVVWSDVKAGSKVAGVPAQEITREHRSILHLRKLPELARKVKELIARVDKLEAPTDHKP